MKCNSGLAFPTKLFICQTDNGKVVRTQCLDSFDKGPDFLRSWGEALSVTHAFYS